MRFTHILVTFATIIAATACSFSEIEDMNTRPENASQYLQVVGRIAQYSDCDVATRSKKEGDEPKVTSMGLALFPIENGTIGNCLYYDFQLGGSIVFIVDRHDEVFRNYENKQFAMYIFANMQDAAGFPKTAEIGVGKSLDYFTECAANTNVNVKDVPENGFPMMGSLGNTNITEDADGIKLILKPTANGNNVDGLPLVNDTPTDNLEIPLKSMYAKFTFTISVKPDQEILGNKAPRFDLLSYEVKNIAATVDAKSSTNDDNDVITSSGEVSMGSYAQGATTANFNFYLPERYLSPSININDVLPDELTDNEKEKYRQRFKNKLIEGKAATYVNIKGKYTDHQGHVYDLDYNIYLGSNNYDDFNIIRNTHYDNSVTIRGISASNDQADYEESVSIDWRVNIDRSTPLVIGLRRESLLDAHFEVRPLRLRLVGENIPTGTRATVKILNENGTETNIPDWVRLEESGNTTNHITTGISTGKRKYFTTDLVTNTLAGGTSVTMNNLNGSNQTVWIYVDENNTTVDRTAIVRISYDGVDKDYKIVQHGLHKVVGSDSGNDYYIEEYEEYLYNYDTEDSYGQTKEEGIPWGLNDVMLSYIYDSFKCEENNTDWNSFIENNPIKYDFYIGKHDDDNDNSDEYTKDGGKLHNFAGLEFTKQIAEKANSGVKYLTLSESANGAVEYCYSRNKRNPDGTVDVKWYLPSADELEDFIVTGYSDFKEFQDNYYWTSQPAYIRNAFYYEYYDGSKSNSNREDTYVFITYEDNPKYARATKVIYANGNYDYVKSGLNKTPKETHDMDQDCKNQGAKVYDDTYFNVMYGWYRWKPIFQSVKTDEKIGDNAMKTDEHFNEYRDGKSTGQRYHIHLGHLYDMIQETDDGEHGYHERTKKNRVRCVRKL